MNYLIKLQMIIAKTIAGLIRIDRITSTQEQFNTVLAELMGMCENNQIQNGYLYLETA